MTAHDLSSPARGGGVGERSETTEGATPSIGHAPSGPSGQLPRERGRTDVTLTSEPFDAGELLSAFSADRLDTGGVVSFTGLCRRDGDVLVLELEAYPGFTEAAIAGEVEAVSAARALHDAQVVHRVGRVAPGEAIVFVATAAAHRRDAFLAADRLMDFLKSRAPFWKKEHTLAGSRWIEPRAQDYEDASRWDAAAEDATRR